MNQSIFQQITTTNDIYNSIDLIVNYNKSMYIEYQAICKDSTIFDSCLFKGLVKAKNLNGTVSVSPLIDSIVIQDNSLLSTCINIVS